jgi:hypothetical protein
VRGYLSSVSPLLHFGLGSAQKIDSIIITWSNNHITKLENINTNQRLSIAYDPNKSIAKAAQNKQTTPKQFETIEVADAFEHTENPFNDFEVEVLLPHKNSTLGPALAVGDLNGDQRDDYIIGSAVGQVAAIYLQNAKGDFERLAVPALEADQYYEDLGIVIFDADNDGDQDFYIASGGNEFKPNSLGYEDRLYENLGNNQFKRNKDALPDLKISGLDVTAADYDKDGDLDLFLGGRLIPKKYPHPANSHILENISTPEGPKFVDATQKVLPDLKEIGLVTASSWIDFDKDGWDDLVVVGEWMPVQFFKNDKGIFKDVTEDLVSDDLSGWWFDIQKGDFDKDGDEDLVIGNLGKNYKYQASEDTPFSV